MARNYFNKPRSRGRSGLLFFLLICLFPFEVYAQEAGLFSAQSLNVEGRTLSVIPADLDGEGSFEIVVVSITGIYPEEKRWISIFSADNSAQ